MKTANQLRSEILNLMAQYSELEFSKNVFIAGQSPVPASGKVLGAPELQLMTEAVMDGWLTTGRFNEAFEGKLAEFLSVKHVLTTNSGSSANLLALSALTSHRLGERRLKPGDEVITLAAGFPTTVNPILQNQLIPVFVDVDIGTYNIDVNYLESALSEKTGAVFIAHTLGNPFDLKTVKAFCDKHGLWLVEDCCDALGSTYQDRHVGGFGDVATFSFYPAHHITMGEGGAVATNSSRLKIVLESFRDWGRDCYCAPGQDNTCNSRFERQLGGLPAGYDHKYTYSHIGYNLKITDMQAACALAQMDRLAGFVVDRKRNFSLLSEGLKPYSNFISIAQATPESSPSWFGFPITINAGVDFTRLELIRYLDNKKIGTRMLFAGNITKQPYFENLNYRVVGNLQFTNRIMHDTFWIGVYPGLDQQSINYVIGAFDEFFAGRSIHV